ncbi:MAG: LysR family transcriptional regulator [Cryobacterium sp.]|nr:LysR family transcriptional regulator [Oligoflexia bacterium]
MTLSSNQLEAFSWLAKSGHFTLAAKRIGVTQSALSQRISKLEDELETTLFIRDRAGVQLTESGLELLRYCQAKESLEAEFVGRLRSGANDQLAGKIRICGYSSVIHSVILPALENCLRENPNVQMILASKEISEISSQLQRGEADFILLDYRLERESVISHRIGEEKLVLVERTKGNIANRFLDHDEADETTIRYLKHAKFKGAVERHYLDDIPGVIAGVELGLGRAVLPLHMIRDSKSLRAIRPEVYLSSPVYLHYYERPYYSKLQQRVSRDLMSRSSEYL